MSSQLPISDLQRLPLKIEGQRLTIVKDSDHLLRRFGQLDVLRLPAGIQQDFEVRAVADTLWTALEGQAKLYLVDRRADSRDKDHTLTLTLDAAQPEAVLVPFGVACAVACEQASVLLRLSTHTENAADQSLPFAELIEHFEAI